MTTFARKLAKVLLEQNRRDGEFKVRLQDVEEAAAVAAALKELGCVVEIEEDQRTLRVDCDESRALRV